MENKKKLNYEENLRIETDRSLKNNLVESRSYWLERSIALGGDSVEIIMRADLFYSYALYGDLP
ncbi:MAG: hypothetical protein ABF461_01180 [Zymomonas mobilis subsp. pomaceae]|uniref:Uncharacterized protein n=1 Tax=Zymomonas mobilis subsp. pomaceae (strain ATCC 29192 / DSM 22645 / JCM 10191 / CCUG 17912 / NBRC 13757 / NCIMB 11200 / NRRL B-4491 / Barker I) TaxID=579138 RepID=F8EVW1_ZYMMT|nr:hypothetical protein [Zymomonas mobilis]AEI37438.1 hypothetical protein Zymop_0536 [Zymomonas mobilis subsp. pomaceae ATCC 29192]MDX5948805.1 hypothetical protein [Zymomonas mobilis subsp. pomaceae]GEB88613.1 hypothetical protein ZMO02_02500 [Zymomonas mobilis subsp. pomaceae]